MTVISSLEVKDFQRVSAVKIEPDDRVIMLFGQNAQGKTSVLDAIETALAGYDSRFTKRPIKEGSGRADIEITLSDGAKIHRKFTPSGSTLVAVDGDGSKLGQKDLNAALSALGPDARAFISKGPKEQLDLLLSIVDLPIDPAALDAEYKQIEDARRLVGQQGKAIGDVEVDPSLPTEITSASVVIESIQAIQTANAEIDRAVLDVADRASVLRREERALEELLRKVEDAREAVEGARLDKVDAEKFAARIGQKTDTGPLEEALANIENANALVAANNVAREQMARKDELRAEYEAHTAKLDSIKQAKTAGLAKAVMPVEGLGFDSEGVLYQGVPFSRASGSEALIVSLAMIIATNPAIRTAVIRDGNVLDARSLGIIQSMCEQTNFQVFIEFVSDSEDHEYQIVDGVLA